MGTPIVSDQFVNIYPITTSDWVQGVTCLDSIWTATCLASVVCGRSWCFSSSWRWTLCRSWGWCFSSGATTWYLDTLTWVQEVVWSPVQALKFWNWNSILVSNTPVAVTGLNCIVATACAWRWCWCFSRCWCCACSGCCRSRSRICWTWAWHFNALAWVQEVVWSPIQALEFWNWNPVLVSNTPVAITCLDSIWTACCWCCTCCASWSRSAVWWSTCAWRWPWTWHLKALTWVEVVVRCAVQTLEFWNRNPVLVGNTPVAIACLDGVWTACCWCCTCCAGWSRRAIRWSWRISPWTWHFNALAWMESVVRCTV